MNSKLFVALAVLSVAGLAHARIVNEQAAVMAVKPGSVEKRGAGLVAPVSVAPVRDLFNKPVVVGPSQREAEVAMEEQMAMKEQMAREAEKMARFETKPLPEMVEVDVEVKPFPSPSQVVAMNKRVSHFIEMLNKFGNDRELVGEFLARYKEMVPEAQRTFDSNVKNAFRDRESLITFLKNVRALLNKIVEG